jgi:hypothetical protein
MNCCCAVHIAGLLELHQHGVPNAATLQLLKRRGLIDELDLMDIHGEGHYYERKLNRDHIHMACLRCGKIMEFVSDIFEKPKGRWRRTAGSGSWCRAWKLADTARHVQSSDTDRECDRRDG